MAEPRVPPGRAGRLRLRRSLDVARRGADLLDQKLRVLRTRHAELLRAEQDAGERWRQRLGQAERWLRRGLLLNGEEALDTTDFTRRAELEVSWASTMGVRHPGSVTCAVPPREPDDPTPANTALLHAEAAYAEAVRAAAAYAAARSASRAVGDEVVRTRRRLRALRRHWVPRLETALAAADRALEQSEHEDAVRRRWAAGARGTPADGRPDPADR
ncbi:V-type ATP synthase subunit D [Streptomyces sp. NPDC101225]|uniref:V-type ATP synthase subunit D n=1 Tax=Streptomyces sp. NPDC101225 TaxID=3366135 RepID=UPI0038078287